MILTLLMLQAVGGPIDGPVATESDAYTLERYRAPQGTALEIGGLDFAPDGALYVSTRRGQVWRVDDALGDDTQKANISLFAEGLWEGLGLRVIDGEIYVLQRSELSRLRDVDGDGRCDSIDTIADDWGVSGHYHEFAFGLPRDSAGNWYLSLNVSFGAQDWWHGRSTVPYRGWVMRVRPDGSVEPVASGFRSPCGISIDSRERVFVTDNQGDWCPSSPIYLLREGAFYGHPKSLDWTDTYRAEGLTANDEIPPARAYTDREPAAIWIPYKWSRSTGNLVEITADSEHGLGKLFAGQYVVAELTNGMLLRAGFEEVQGTLQGWVVPLREGIGSVVRVLEAPDGSLLCGLTNRGWGGKAPADGLARVRWTGRTPLEIHSMRIVDAEGDATNFGFELTFTRPVSADWSPSLQLVQYDYDYWWEYGSPERHKRQLEVDTVELSADRTRLLVRTPDLLPAMVARLTLTDCVAEDGAPLLHPEIAYTVNQLPSGARTNALVAKIVPPPSSRGTRDEGMLRLTWGDALGQLDAPFWRLVSVSLDAENPTRFRETDGNGALVGPGRLRTRGRFGSAQLHAEVQLAEGAEALIGFEGFDRALRLVGGSSKDAARPTAELVAVDRFGALALDRPALAPIENARYDAGEWHEVDVYVTGGTVDDEGRLQGAWIEKVMLNDELIHEDVSAGTLTGFSRALGEERRPFFIEALTPQGVAVRNLQAKPSDRRADGDPFAPVDVVELWERWTVQGDAEWELEGSEIIGKGALGHLLLEGLADCTAIRFDVMVNGNGAGALVLDATEESGAVHGTTVTLNTSFPNQHLTGSISENASNELALATELVASDAWVTMQVEFGTANVGTDELPRRDVRVLLNGVEVNHLQIGQKSAGQCALALRVDHDGTVLRLRNLEVLR